MTARPKIPKEIETRVLTTCLRRCCVCYFVHGVTTPKKGQIAHINKKREDHRYENLAFLCLEHHDEYDSTTSQSKNFTPGEIFHYKDCLIEALGNNTRSMQEEMCEEEEVLVLRSSASQASLLTEPWRQRGPWDRCPTLYPYKSPNGADGICRIEKIELSDQRILIVCEELEDNPGMSVTNAVEWVAAQVCRTYDIDPLRLVWIEHYDANLFGNDSWDIVRFGEMSENLEFVDPTWKNMTPLDWESLGLKLLTPEAATQHKQRSRISKIGAEIG